MAKAVRARRSIHKTALSYCFWRKCSVENDFRFLGIYSSLNVARVLCHSELMPSSPQPPPAGAIDMSDNRRVFATRLMPIDVEARFHREFDAIGNEADAVLSSEDIISGAEGCRAIICSPTEKMDADTIASLPQSVELLATFSVGCDHIDLQAAAKRALIVTNTPDVLTDATADTTLLCLLGAARMAQESERIMRVGQWGRWAPRDMLGVHMSGKRLGIVGMGRIGQAVARRAQGFDMQVMYHNRRELDPQDNQGATFYAHASEMLPKCDFLALTCPLTPETRSWLNA